MDKYVKQLKDYNETVSAYYAERTSGRRKETWTGQMADMLAKQVRMDVKEFVERKKLDLC